MSTVDTATAAAHEPKLAADLKGAHKPRPVDAINDMIGALAEKQSLDSWNSFIHTLDVPADVAVAMLSNRPEMLAMVHPRDMTAGEVETLYKIIGNLLETNQALRTHAAHTARLVDTWSSAFKQLASVGHQIQCFANFRRTDEDIDE